MTEMRTAYDVDTTYAGTTACPLLACCGEGEYVQWAWHSLKWRELLRCDLCGTRFYSGAVRLGLRAH